MTKSTSETKECVACAERIKVGAKLCRYCDTLQSDERFVAKSRKSSRARTFQEHRQCLKCQRKLQVDEPAICTSCQFHLDKHERAFLQTGAELELCPTCSSRYFLVDFADECVQCEAQRTPFKNQPPWKLGALKSWWVQLIFLLPLAFNPELEILSFFPAVFLSSLGGQLLFWDALLVGVLAIIYLVRKNNQSETIRIKTWIFSVLVFMGLGFIAFLIGLMMTIAISV